MLTIKYKLKSTGMIYEQMMIDWEHSEYIIPPSRESEKKRQIWENESISCNVIFLSCCCFQIIIIVSSRVAATIIVPFIEQLIIF